MRRFASPARALVAISLLTTAAVMGNPFFAFDNGVGGLPPAKQATLLTQLGYDGISYTGTEAFAARRNPVDIKIENNS